MIRKRKLKESYMIIFFLLILAVLPLIVSGSYWLQVFVLGEFLALIVMSLFLLSGLSGQISLGHAGFYAIGAYTSAILCTRLGISPWITIFIGAIAAGIVGLIIGYPSLRLRGPYFIISTVGFCEIVYLTVLNWTDLTRGPMGITGIPPLTSIKLGGLVIDFSQKITFYYLLIVVIAIASFLVYNLVNSRTGNALKAIRDDDIAASCMGINLAYYKVLAFVISAMLAGLAGGLYAHFMRFVSPETFTLGESINYLVLLLVGGSASLLSAFLGGIGMSTLLESMRFLSGYRLIVYGVILVLVILFMPSGLAGLIHKAAAAIKKKAGDFKVKKNKKNRRNRRP
jgi:branched-chain amino acid transport system permease protein